MFWFVMIEKGLVMNRRLPDELVIRACHDIRKRLASRGSGEKRGRRDCLGVDLVWIIAELWEAEIQ